MSRFSNAVNNLLERNGLLLTEQAKSRYDAEQKVVSLGKQINIHVLKCLIYGPDCQAFNHWVNEIENWLSDIKFIRLKPKNTVVSVNDRIKWGTEIICNFDKFDKDSFNTLVNYVVKNSNDDKTIGLSLVMNHGKDVYDLLCKLYSEKTDVYGLCQIWFNAYPLIYFKNSLNKEK